MTLDELAAAVAEGRVDTVVACFPDMQGRLAGKRFHARYFLDGAWHETHACNYLLATDMDMNTVGGYRSAGWEHGYGDHVLRPDLSTLRIVPWLEKTALVLCDVLDHHGGHEVPHAPRTVLKGQVQRLKDRGWQAVLASELEFFLFEESYEVLERQAYRDMRTLGRYNEDYHIFQTTKEEGVLRRIRNGLEEAGIPVECTKGEASAGQGEINIRHAGALAMADRHVILKNACKEIAWQQGRALTFMAKWSNAAAGSSAHIHQSLWTLDGEPLFFDAARPRGMSLLMEHWLAGQLAHTGDIAVFLAPGVNSYKRFAESTFAPTRVVWSPDNRTAGYRLCGEGGRNIRVECRIGGADLNPCLAFAALIAAGLEGIDRGLLPGEPFSGNAYLDRELPGLPASVGEAAERLDQSGFLRTALGDDVVDHYVRAARWERELHERVVTDHELRRGFEGA